MRRKKGHEMLADMLLMGVAFIAGFATAELLDFLWNK